MAFPASGGIQFRPGQGTLFVDNVVDPTNAPVEVLDIATGFDVVGRVVLPNWLTGTGDVSIIADERGGPFDQAVAKATLTITGGAAGGAMTVTYPYSINVKAPAMPAGPKLYKLSAMFVFLTAAGASTGIVGFSDIGEFLVN
ncbi:hypothetical protein [Actinoplanes sp. RD1]|uniref:hypothetical protein n=1 Tax=Actinoplanes sp. RD1 TaxID=3064538 RepID=UPI0027413C3F|nr:hypothetical protein [Actinoplanes sp. RD1]